MSSYNNFSNIENSKVENKPSGKLNYMDYNRTKNYISENFNIRTQREYFKIISGINKDMFLPSNPRIFYSKEWLGWGDFLGTKRVSYSEKEFYSIFEFSNFIKENNISSKSEYKKLYNILGDDKLPSNPDKTYKKKWNILLGKKKKKFLNFIDGREYAHKLKIKSNKEWIKWVNNNNINFLPTYPNNVYKEWISWMDWLGNKSIMSYKDAKIYLFDKNLNTISDYHIWHDTNKIDFLPKIPHKYYKEFVGYEDYLSYNINYSKFIKYSDAKIYIRKFNIRTQRDYKIWQKSNNITFLPNWPDGVYDEWVSWNDYLSVDKKHSSGENIIENILTRMNIKYIKQKRFNDCRNKLPLPFDFYLPDMNTCIEYDGEQHFKEVNIFGGIDRFKNQRTNDNIKNIYCLEKNINLIRIPYWEILNIESVLKNKIEYGII